MDDLISRQAAIDACHNYEDGKNAYAYGDVVEKRLKTLPSAQPEIIRCKDCKFLRLTGIVWKCQNRLVMMLCEPNDYCSRAERKEHE